MVSVPSYIVLGTLVVMLAYQIGMHYLDRWLSTLDDSRRVLSSTQVLAAWTYFVGISCGLTVIIMMDMQLDVLANEFPHQMVGIQDAPHKDRAANGVLFVIADALILAAIYRVARQEALLMEDYTGDVRPLPLFQDPKTSEWDAGLDQDESCCFEPMPFLGPAAASMEEGFTSFSPPPASGSFAN